MIYEDLAAAVVVALFIWLVPVRRNGIPGGLRLAAENPAVPAAHASECMSPPGRADPG